MGKFQALWFSIRISRQKEFTEKFVEKYVALATELIFDMNERRMQSPIAAKIFKQGGQNFLKNISRVLLESEMREYLLKIVSDLPIRQKIIPTESEAAEMKTCRVFGKARELMSCANCFVVEETEKQFQKCSRCGFVFYCGKACQRNDWKNHKQVCKEIRKKLSSAILLFT